ncbi:MAG: type II secretion system F family protein [Opitutales bacterium]|jgi:type II secretory pathway component PulF
MATYRYSAIDAQGRTVSGEKDGRDKREITNQLLRDKLKPIFIKPKKGPEGNAAPKTDQTRVLFKSSRTPAETIQGEPKTRKPLFRKSSEQAGLPFLKRLHELHSSGMPIADSVKLLNQRLSDPIQKEIAANLWKELAEGRSLARAMRRMPQAFGESATYVVEAGEATGNVAPILAKIISHMEENRAIRTKVVGSMAYPAFICCVALGVVIFFLLYLLPQIQDMLESLGGEMNFGAKLLIHGSEMLLKLGPFLLAGLGIIFFGIFQWGRSEKGKIALARAMLRVPLVGSILYYSELFQLTSLMDTLVSSGIGLTENLRLVEKTIGNESIKRNFHMARIVITEGRSLPDAFRQYRVMPVMQLDVLDIGEKTGNLAHSLGEIANTYRNELSRRIKRMTNIVSGGALGFAFGLVALVAVSIVTSIFQVSKSISF